MLPLQFRRNAQQGVTLWAIDVKMRHQNLVICSEKVDTAAPMRTVKGSLPIIPYQWWLFYGLLLLVCGATVAVMSVAFRYDIFVRQTDLVSNVHDWHKNPKAFSEPLQNPGPAPPYVSQATTIDWKTVVPTEFLTWTLSDNKGCPLCGPMRHSPSSNSSSRDLVITVMINMTTNAATFVRTLRSTGCKATVVVFVDQLFMNSLNSRQIKMFVACGVNFINIGQFNQPYRDKVYEARHLLIYDFLLKYRSDFDRVIFIDMADSFFQMDPFTTDFGYYTMGVTSELVTLNNDPTNNTRWIQIADPQYFEDEHFYDDRVAVNAGFVFGSMDGFLKYYSVFFSLLCFKRKFAPETIDQGYVNMLYHKGYFQRAGLDLMVTHPGDWLVSVRGAAFNYKPNRDGLFVMQGTNVAPAAIHQYSRICPVLKGLKSQCSRLWYDKHAFPQLKAVTQECKDDYLENIMDLVTVDKVKATIQKIHTKLPLDAIRQVVGGKGETEKDVNSDSTTDQK